MKRLNLNLDMSKVSQEELANLQTRKEEIHELIRNRSGQGNEFMDWLTWPVDYDKEEVERMIAKSNQLKEMGVEKLLVVGIGGSFLGAQSAIDFVKGKLNMQDKIIFAGINMSSSHYKQIENLLEGSDWAICVISKSGTTLEPALAFRYFKDLLKESKGEEYRKYIVSVTDGNKGALKELSDAEGYETFVVPDGIGGRFSGITPVGLFPMEFAGLNIKSVLNGAKEAMDDFASLENNIAYDYALTRFALYENHGLVNEIFTSYDFDMEMTGEWFKQLFGESEGKDGKAIMPMSVSYSRDLHSLGQIIQEGTKTFFETTLWVEEDDAPIVIKEDENNLDGLNYLAGKTLHEINAKAFAGVLDAHYNGGNTPNIVLTLKDKSEETLGYLWYFYFIAVTMSAYMLGVNPFDQPGVELYKKNMFENLKK